MFNSKRINWKWILEGSNYESFLFNIRAGIPQPCPTCKKRDLKSNRGCEEHLKFYHWKEIVQQKMKNIKAEKMVIKKKEEETGRNVKELEDKEIKDKEMEVDETEGEEAEEEKAKELSLKI